MLSIRFTPEQEWWVSSAVFERLVTSAITNHDLPADAEVWIHRADANGGFGLARHPPDVRNPFMVGLVAAARRELADVAGRLENAVESDHSADWSYRESLKKLLSLELQPTS